MREIYLYALVIDNPHTPVHSLLRIDESRPADQRIGLDQTGLRKAESIARVHGFSPIASAAHPAATHDIRGYNGADGGKAPLSCLTVARPQTSAKADEGAFSVDNRMAGYRVEPTPERPTNDGCERQVVAGECPSPANASMRYTYFCRRIFIWHRNVPFPASGPA